MKEIGNCKVAVMTATVNRRFSVPCWLLFSRFLFQCNHRNGSEESHLKAFTLAGRLSYETAMGLNIKNIQMALKKKKKLSLNGNCMTVL